jgi:hypothetical protein
MKWLRRDITPNEIASEKGFLYVAGEDAGLPKAGEDPSLCLRGVRLSKRFLIFGRFGHAARLRRSMVSSS